MKIALNNYSSKISFGSDEHREMQLRMIREQQLREQERIRERERRREEERLNNQINLLNKNINKTITYQSLTDPICDNMAAFMLNFSCSMILDSEHSLGEFFGTEEQASQLRESLSPDCKKTSQQLRSELMTLKISQDPIFGLITVNRLKDYMPEEGILSDEQYGLISNASKSACLNLIKAADDEDFDDDEKQGIKELINIAETAKGLNFGDGYDKKLSALIERVNSKRQQQLNKSEHTQTFIAPVEIRYQEREKQIQNRTQI